MPNIVTLTMNPALDKSTRTHHVVSEDKLRCASLYVEAGGGGVNVARAIHKLGGETLLIYTAGGLSGEVLQELLRLEQLAQLAIPIAGPTRESFTVLEETTLRQYRFNMPGPELTSQEWEGCLQIIADLYPQPAYLVASGSLPRGVPVDFYLRVANITANWRCRLLVDTSGPALRAVLAEGSSVYLIKPNLGELNDIAGRELKDDNEIIEMARALIHQGCCQVVVISLGAGGALLVTGSGSEHLRAPTVPIHSKIGAGDSMVAGITLGLSRGNSLLEAVLFGIATGSAAVMTPGTELCRREDAERLYALMQREQFSIG